MKLLAPRPGWTITSDVIIVGSGIHGADDPASSAKAYADASWAGLLNR